MNKTCQTLLIMAAGLFAAGSVMAAVTLFEEKKIIRSNEHYTRLPATAQTGKTLIVYYSRSGYTRLMAAEIARANAGSRLVELTDNSYKPGFKGYAKAVLHAGKKEAAITPDTLDLAAYDTVYIGSPIWLSRPAPPAWQFVKSNDLKGKKVILFTTMSSKFWQKHISEFADSVRRKGGTFIKHIAAVSAKKDSAAFVKTVRSLLK